MWPVLGRTRRTTALVCAVAALAGTAACGADREAPRVARPSPPTTTSGSDTTAPRRTTTTTPTTAPTSTTTERRPARTTTTTERATTTSTATALESTTSTASTTPSTATTTGAAITTATTTTSQPADPAPTAPASTTAATASTSSTSTTTTLPVSPAWAAFDAELASRLIGRGDYAASVAVSVGGQLVHTAAFGVRVPPPPPLPADPAAPPPPVPGETPPPSDLAPPTMPAPVVPLEPAEPADRFRIASISKVITAIVVLQFVEAGRIGLDEPVGDRLVQQVGAVPVDPGVSAITVRHLLSHTAGFPSYQRTFFGGSVDSCPTVANLGLSRALSHAPGTYYEYSNLSYCLLGLLIEQLTGRPYADVVGSRLLQPLGIDGMRLAGTFDTTESEVVHPSIPGRNYMEVLGAAGSWVATPADIVKIVDSLDVTTPGFHPLKAETVELMRQGAPPPVVYKPDRWYGLGLIVYVDGAWGHTGTVENTHAMVLRRPDGVTWSVLVSGETPYDTEGLRRIFDESVAAAGVTFS
jgi:D-alanyl-D-alanine carboxypeptidase